MYFLGNWVKFNFKKLFPANWGLVLVYTDGDTDPKPTEVKARITTAQNLSEQLR